MAPPWVIDNAILIAVIGFSGVFSGHITNAMTARRSTLYRLLLDRVNGLEDRVKYLEDDRARLEAEARESQRQFWHALEYLRIVLSWGRSVVALVPDSERDRVPDEPAPPAVLDNKL